MPSNSKYTFPAEGGNQGLDSLRVKQALIDSYLGSKLNNIVNNQLRNPGFYESVAKVLASSYLPVNGGSIEGNQQINKNKINDKIFNLVDQAIPYSQQGFSDENQGLFESAVVIPNIQLISNYTQLNFFDSAKNVETDEIVIDIPLCSMSYSYSNKYKESQPVGYNGTIKELVGTSNLSINIEGVFVARYIGIDKENSTQNMPDLRNFQLMCMRNKIATVSSEFIADKTILNDYFADCVVKNFTLPQDNSSKNIQRFTMRLESDKPLDII
jgi:hypothetical protein